MRKRILMAALLATTAIVRPGPAQAGPVVGFVQGFVAAISGSAFLGGGVATAGFISGAIASTYVAGFFGTFLGKALLGLGASALTAALIPRPDIPKPSQQLQNYVQPITHFERGYGKLKKGGVVGFRSGIVDKQRHMAVTIAAHPTEGPVEHWLDLREVTVNSAGDVLTSPFYKVKGEASIAKRASIRAYTGAAAQATDATLLAEFPEVTADHDFARHSYAAMWFRKPPQEQALEIYTQGREPVYAPVWKMWNEIYDPRDDSTGYSNNWALCFAHELTQVWGLTVDWDRVGTEADICDELVTNGDGGQQRRWTFNSVFTSDQDFEMVTTAFLAAANGFMYQRTDGKVDFYAGRYIAPSLTLSHADFFEARHVIGNRGLRPTTEFTCEYREPDNGYRETRSAAYVLTEVGKTVSKPLAIYGVDSHNQALRILKPIAESERAEFKISGKIGWAGYEVIGGRDHEDDLTGAGGLAHRFVYVDHPLIPDGTPFEVSKCELEPDGNTFAVELASTSSEAWAFNAATEEPARPENHAADVAGSDEVDTINDLAGEVVTGTGGVAQIRWYWTAADESLIPVLRLREVGGEWAEVELPPETSEFIQSGLIDGQDYEAQLRARTSGYSTSEWKPDTPVSIEAVADTSPPAAHDSAEFTLTELSGDVTVSFEAPSDANYYATRVYRADYAASYSGSYDQGEAVLVRLEYGLPNSVDSWTDAALSAGHYAYWIEPINGSGIAGTVTGPETIEIV